MNAVKPKKVIASISIKFLFVAIAFLSSIFLFAGIAHETVMEKEELFDQRIASYLLVHVGERLISLMAYITFFGSTAFLLPSFIVLIIVLLVLKQKRNAIHVAIIGITSTLLLSTLKNIFHRTRPEWPLIQSLKNFSFPSGHALSSFIFCSILVYLVSNSQLRPVFKWIINVLLLIFSLLIGVSRIILRMHYATDVIAGFCLGIAWVIFSFWIMRKMEEKKNSSINIG